ncbi:DUF5655 domain-containing protein [Humibacillus xanthopallidus]|uniref:DUF5655 domain-containing protein n=1 Tax=Humibacillus xanthopallidus TaxID=412689 RepID=A0A543I2K8_9MICO|nr:DUF5655 domain-containing protein [Humibacillus xanthopallidus]TQM64834.1 hypothetical protein FBY41_1214 [Humibacillus xanthopallidus]
MHADAERTPAQFFAGHPRGLAVYAAVARAVEALGPAEVTVSKSQIAFRRRRGFAYVWRPGQYVKSDVPAVLSLALPQELASARFKDVVHPSAGVWMHHLELDEPAQVDDEVCGWLRLAFELAE